MAERPGESTMNGTELDGMTPVEPLLYGEFLEDPDGWIIHIEALSATAMESLMNLFLQLSTEEIRSLDLCHWAVLEIHGIAKFILTVDHRARDTGATLRVDRSKRGYPDVSWELSPDGWRTCAELLEPLLDESGHQYLTRSALDEATVEVSRRARLDDP